jgi:hypothetical protein
MSSNLDWDAVLKEAQTYRTDEPDEYKIARALKALYPDEIEGMKAVPGYTPEELLGFMMEKLRGWARTKSPPLFRAIMTQRYAVGGLYGEEAERIIEGELAAALSGYFMAQGDKNVGNRNTY